MKSARNERAPIAGNAPYSNDFPLALRRAGYTEYGRRLNVDPDRHLLRTYGLAPAFNAEAIGIYRANNVVELVAQLRDGTELRIPLRVFLQNARRIELGGYEPQFVCNRKYWSTNNSHQLSIFGSLS